MLIISPMHEAKKRASLFLARTTRMCTSITDISQAKLDLMTKAAVSDCKTALADKDPKKTAAKIEEILGEKPDVVFDATCSQPGITTAIYVSIGPTRGRCNVISKYIRLCVISH